MKTQKTMFRKGKPNMIVYCLCFVIFIIVVPICLSYGMLKLLNNNQATYYQAITNGTYDYDVFFNPKIEDIKYVYEKEHIEDEVFHFEFIDYLNEQYKIHKDSDFQKFCLENKDEIINWAKSDPLYIQYLKNKSMDIEMLSKIIDEYGNIINIILCLSFYISLTLFWLVSVYVCRLRVEFYIMTGIIYIILTLSSFSDGILDYYLANLWNLFDGSTDYGTIPDTKLMYETCKESMMTYIIFDTVMPAIHEKSKYKKVRKEILYLSNILPSNYLLLQSVQYTANQDFILRLKIDSGAIFQLCESEIEIINKKKNKLYGVEKKLFQRSISDVKVKAKIDDLEYKNRVFSSLQDDITVFSGKVPYNIDTYIKAMNGLIIGISKVSDILN